MHGKHCRIPLNCVILALVLQFGQTHSACVYPNGGLQHWYRFDNGIRTNSRASYSNGILSSSIDYIVERGAVGNSLFISNGTFEIVHNPPVPSVIGDRSIEMWIRVDAVPNKHRVLFSQYDTVPQPLGYIVGVSLRGKMTVQFSHLDSFTAETDKTIADDKWHHILLVVYSDGRIPVLSIDGIEQALVGARALNCCARFPSSPFRLEKGRFDEVSIYNNALTVGDFESLYNAGSSGKCGFVPYPNIGTKQYLESKGANCTPPATCSFNTHTPVLIDHVVLDARNYTISVLGNLTFEDSVIVVNEHTSIIVEQCPTFVDSTVRVFSNKTVVWFAAFPPYCYIDTNTVTLDHENKCKVTKKEPSKIGSFVHLGSATCGTLSMFRVNIWTIALVMMLLHTFTVLDGR